MLHAHADGNTYWPFDTGCSEFEHVDSSIVCSFRESCATLDKLFDTCESYPEPLKLLIPGWIEGEPLDSRLLGVTMKLKPDIGVRVAIGVGRWQVLTLLQGYHDSTLQATRFARFAKLYGKPNNSVAWKQPTAHVTPRPARIASHSDCRVISQGALPGLADQAFFKALVLNVIAICGPKATSLL